MHFTVESAYEKIQAVLEKSIYRESTLIAKGLVEDQIERERIDVQQKKILGYLENNEIGGLVQTIEDLTTQLKVSEQTAVNVRQECNTIQEENATLKADNQRLLAENTLLKQQYPAFRLHQQHGTENPRDTREDGRPAHKPR